LTKENSSRRRFIQKIATLGLASGVGTLVLGRLSGKELMPPVHAADLVIDADNTGTGRTRLTSSGAVHDTAFEVESTKTTGDTEAMYAIGRSPDGEAIQAHNFATTGYAHALYGSTSSPTGRAVCGYAPGTGSGAGTGVYGQSGTTAGRGVEGLTEADSGESRGVFGHSASTSGRGVYGEATATTGSTVGVYGTSASTTGTGVYASATATTGSTYGLSALNTSKDGRAIQAWASGADGIGIIALGAKAGLYTTGRVGVGTDGPLAGVHISTTALDPLRAAGAPGAGPAPNSFIVENLTTGNFKSQFTFRYKGANKWSFGNDMSGNGSQNFFIFDEVAGAIRLYVASNGYTGIGTTSPAQMLHVAGRVKATGYDTGDIRFANSFTVTEDEKTGLAFKNDTGEKVAVLDREGNLHIKGRIIQDI